MTRAAPLLIAACLPLAACKRAEPDTAPVPATVAANLPTIPCALAGAPTFGEDCTVERVASDRGWTLVMHHPDGGFRRLSVTTDGRGVAAADGAQPAAVAVIAPGTIEVAIAGDRYRLPATIEGQTPPAR